MRTRIPAISLTLLFVASILVGQSTAGRAKSWEFGVAAGATSNNPGLRNYSTSARLLPTLSARVGYAITDNLGLSVGVATARAVYGSSFFLLDGPSYLAPFVAASWTVSSAARVSPFVSVGMQSTRITARVSQASSNWGGQVGLGVLIRASQRAALRLEGRTASQRFSGAGQSYTSTVTAGLSIFTNGCR